MSQGKGHWWYRVRRELVLYLVRTYASSAKDVLDVGCASGDTLEVLQGAYKVSGLETSDEALRVARARGFSVVTASLPNIPHPDNSFDVVLMLDVLEHIEDDSAAVREVQRVLRPGGIFITFVPAYMFLWSVTDVRSHHFRRYTRPELVSVMKSAEFSIIRSSYFNTLLFPAIASVRLVTRLFGIHMTTEMSPNLNIFNGLLYSIFHLELSPLTFVDLPFGVSIFSVARKQS